MTNDAYANGLNGATGAYLRAVDSPDDFVRAAQDEIIDDKHQRELKHKVDDQQPHFAPEGGLDPQNLAESGWGVLFAPGMDAIVRAALQPLLKLRAQQAGGLYKEFSTETSNGFQAGDSYLDFLARSRMG